MWLITFRSIQWNTLCLLFLDYIIQRPKTNPLTQVFIVWSEKPFSLNMVMISLSLSLSSQLHFVTCVPPYWWLMKISIFYRQVNAAETRLLWLQFMLRSHEAKVAVAATAKTSTTITTTTTIIIILIRIRMVQELMAKKQQGTTGELSFLTTRGIFDHLLNPMLHYPRIHHLTTNKFPLLRWSSSFLLKW